jgi:hypothetical protein
MEALQRSAAPSAPGRPARNPAPVILAPVARTEPPLSEVEAFLSRAKPRCVVHVLPHSEHVTQIYAGLYALHASGRAVVRQSFDPAALRRRLAGTGVDCRIFDENLHGLLVEVEGTRLVFFDVRDGGGFREDILDAVALYAKRSFHRGVRGPSARKTVPLGVNYPVYHDRSTALELAKALRQLDRSRCAVKRVAYALARTVPALGRKLDLPTAGSLAARRERTEPPRAIFLARTWAAEELPGLSPEIIEGLNDTRAGCIRLLRKRFGERFLGGLARSANALKRYPDCVVDEGISTRRRDYLARLRDYSICIATTGLFDSTGWKFAEYLAFGKAIVCEPMKFELPGPIAAGRNFLEFTTPEGCAARVGELLENRDARARMMADNAAYFAEFGAPGAVVARVLHAALKI